MIQVKENRLLILEENGDWISYKKEIARVHDDCMKDYCEKKGLNSLNIFTVIKNTNSVILYNISDDVIVVYLPSRLTDEQLYQLELLADIEFSEVSYLEARKLKDHHNIEDFCLSDNISYRFSEEIIQSYYGKNSKQR